MNEASAFVNAVLDDNKRLRTEVDAAKAATEAAVNLATAPLTNQLAEAEKDGWRLRGVVAALMDHIGMTRIEIRLNGNENGKGDIPASFGEVDVRVDNYERLCVVSLDKPTQPGSYRVDMTLVKIKGAA